MVWKTWQIVLTVLGGTVFIVFQTLSIIRDIKARKAKKAEAVYYGESDGSSDGDGADNGNSDRIDNNGNDNGAYNSNGSDNV